MPEVCIIGSDSEGACSKADDASKQGQSGPTTEE